MDDQDAGLTAAGERAAALADRDAGAL